MSQPKKSKPRLSPEAAKILEQYRSAGKTPPPDPDSDAPATDGGGAAPRPTPPPSAAPMRRSGTRGK